MVSERRLRKRFATLPLATFPARRALSRRCSRTVAGMEPSVHWNERSQRWMAWVRYPDGSRRKIERIREADARRDLRVLLDERHAGITARTEGSVTFAALIDAWIDAGCPNVVPVRSARHVVDRSAKTKALAGQLLRANVVASVGDRCVDKTTTVRLEKLFAAMADDGKSTSTIDHTFSYLNQACQWGVRTERTTANPAANVLLPARRSSARARKTFTVEQVCKLVVVAIPAGPRPAMWLTGLMCGLRPSELVGLRWSHVDIDTAEPVLRVEERALEVNDIYFGQGAPKTERSRRTIALHPLVVEALIEHRAEQKADGRYRSDGFVFATRNWTPMTMKNLRRAFRTLCVNAGSATVGRPMSFATRSCHCSRTNSMTSPRSPTSPGIPTHAPPRATATPSDRPFPTPPTPGTASSM